MSLRIRVAQFGLCMVSALGIYCIWIQSRKNGTSVMIREAVGQKSYLEATSKIPLRTVYTGIPAIDSRFQVLAIIFWHVFSGSIPASSIQSLHFAGQYVAVLVLLLLEAMRRGNKGTMVFYVSWWIGVSQIASFAITIPIFLILHLSTSGTILPSINSLAPNGPDLVSLPIAITAGFLIPTGLLSLPVPSMATFDQKQIYNAIWQVFPIWISMAHYLSKKALPLVFPSLNKPSRTITAALLRLSYLYGLFFACITHGASLTLPIAYDLAPSIFSSDMKDSLSFGLSRTFVPTYGKVPSVAEGVFEILKNDEWIGSTGLILWASVLFINAWPIERTPLRYLCLLVGIGLLTSLVGPVGCALALIWARDEICFAKNDPEEKAK